MRNFGIVKNRNIIFAIEAVIILITIVSVVLFGIKLDIQFKGGSIITYSYDGAIDQAVVEDMVAEHFGPYANVQYSNDYLNNKENIVISMTESLDLSNDTIGLFNAAVKEAMPENNFEMASVNRVDPLIGGEFLLKCVIAVAFSSLLTIIYVAIRFKILSGWSAGTMAVVALLCDVTVVFATFVVMRFPINANFIAVVLTILGYSINNTIVVYDRIRENSKNLKTKVPGAFEEMVNKSVNQSLTRSINTTLATVLALVTICVMAFIYNINDILTFSFPLITGLLSGLFTSVCIAPNLWVAWKLAKTKKAKAKK